MTKSLKNHKKMYFWGYPMKLVLSKNGCPHVVSSSGLKLLREWDIIQNLLPQNHLHQPAANSPWGNWLLSMFLRSVLKHTYLPQDLPFKSDVTVFFVFYMIHAVQSMDSNSVPNYSTDLASFLRNFPGMYFLLFS